MRKNYFSLFLLCLFFSLDAQSFLPASWMQGVYYHGNAFNSPPDGNSSVNHVQDTTMCGYTYAEICRRNPWPSSTGCYPAGYLRKQGSRIFHSDICGATEQVYFDFGLVVGDTITINQGFFHTGRYQVDSTYNITLLDGSVRKKLVLLGQNNWNATDTLRWIEDIGDMTMGMAPTADFEGGRGYLLCHKENGIKRYENVLSFTTVDCDTLLTSFITGTEAPQHAFAVTPNPFSGHIDISLGGLAECEFLLYDCAGRVCMKQHLDGDTRVEAGAILPAGLYLAAMRTTDGKVQYLRLLKSE